MTGNRHYFKENERRTREAVKEARDLRALGCEYSTCEDLTRFVVRAPQQVVVELLRFAVDAAAACRPWFSDGSGPTSDGLYAAAFTVGSEDAKRVRAFLREQGITGAH